ncbi:MAG: hypothetical protein JST35_12410 [Armatimonadetes bacterium]|nr:hypothetical protein [Armatimonadota bacterium]
MKASERIAAIKLLGDFAFPAPREVILEQGAWIDELARITAQHLGNRERFLAWHEELQQTLNDLAKA